MKWATIALFVCVTGKDDARGPPMWNAAHLCGLRWPAWVRSTPILRCSGAQSQTRLLSNPSHNLLRSGGVVRRALLSRTECATILRSVSLHQTNVRLSNVLKIITGAAARLHRE